MLVTESDKDRLEQVVQGFKAQKEVKSVSVEWTKVRVKNTLDPYTFNLKGFWRVWKVFKRQYAIVPLVGVDTK